MNKILVIQTAFLGDVVLATSLIEKLIKFYPDSELHFLLRAGNEHILKGHPHLKKLWVWNKKKKYTSLLKIVKALRNERYDVIINLHRFFSSGSFTVFAGAKETRGFRKNPLSPFFDKKFDHQISPDSEGHEIERNHQLIQDLTDSTPMRPVLYPSEVDYSSVQKFKHNEYFTIAPASVWYTKQWPKTKWIELIYRLDRTLNIYLLGAPGDKELCDTILKACSGTNIINLAGELGPLASVALMENAKMNFVNDSAPLHFASSVNAPVRAVFCSTIKNFGFGPLSDDSAVVEVEQPLACRPCGLHGHRSCPQGHFKCAMDISVNKLLTSF